MQKFLVTLGHLFIKKSAPAWGRPRFLSDNAREKCVQDHWPTAGAMPQPRCGRKKWMWNEVLLAKVCTPKEDFLSVKGWKNIYKDADVVLGSHDISAASVGKPADLCQFTQTLLSCATSAWSAGGCWICLVCVTYLSNKSWPLNICYLFSGGKSTEL